MWYMIWYMIYDIWYYLRWHDLRPGVCKNSRQNKNLQGLVCSMRPASDKIIATEELAFCKWSSRGAGLLQMIIQRDWALANDHPEGAASCGSSSRVACLLQMIIRHPRHPSHLCKVPVSISRSFLEQFVLVLFVRLYVTWLPIFCFFICKKTYHWP